MFYAFSTALRPGSKGSLPLAMNLRTWLSPILTPPWQGIHRGPGDWDMPTWNLCQSALLDLASETLDSRIPCSDGPKSPFSSLLAKADGATVWTLQG